MTAPTKTVRRFDRELVPVTTVDAAQTSSQEVIDFTNAWFKALARAEQQQEDDAFFERLTGSKPGQSTRELLFGKESK